MLCININQVAVQLFLYVIVFCLGVIYNYAYEIGSQ